MESIEITPQKSAKRESKGIAAGSLGPALNPRQRAFVREAAGYPLSGVQLKEAYRRAGYSERSDGGPQRLLAIPRVRHEIDQLERRKAIDAGARLAAVIHAQCRIAFANLADFVEFEGDGSLKLQDGVPVLRTGITREQLDAISSFSLTDKGVSFNVDRWTPLKALREFLAPNKAKVELTGADDGPIKLDLRNVSDDDLSALERILEAAADAASDPGGSRSADQGEDRGSP